MNQDYARRKYKQKYRDEFEFRKHYQREVDEEKIVNEITNMLAEDILEGKLKDVDENSLYRIIYYLYKEGMITFEYRKFSFEKRLEISLIMAVVKMRYLTIIPKLIMLDCLQSTLDALIYAIENEDLELLKTIVVAKKESGKGVVESGFLTRYTVNNKGVDILEYLIENHISYDVLAMQIAKKEKNQKMLEVLLEKSPFLKDFYIQALVFDGDTELAKAIVRTNRLDIANDDKFIKVAVSWTSDSELVKMLITAGANVNAKYNGQEACSGWACRGIKKGREDYGDVLGRALMSNRKLEIAELLRQAGANDRKLMTDMIVVAKIERDARNFFFVRMLYGHGANKKLQTVYEIQEKKMRDNVIALACDAIEAYPVKRDTGDTIIIYNTEEKICSYGPQTDYSIPTKMIAGTTPAPYFYDIKYLLQMIEKTMEKNMMGDFWVEYKEGLRMTVDELYELKK